MTRGRQPDAHAASHDGAASAHMASSFTDLMASLMVIFILLFMAVLSNAVAVQRNARDTTIEALLGALKSALAAGGMDAGGIEKDERDPYAVVIVMPEDLLFKRGDWIVGERGRKFLGGMIPQLSRIVCTGELRGKVANVVVEGHTDNVWTTTVGQVDGPQMNLELSQKRSMDVVRWSLATLATGDERDCFRRLLSASGRGQEELLPDVAGDDSSQRRVVFKIRTQRDAVEGVAGGLAGSVGATEAGRGEH